MREVEEEDGGATEERATPESLVVAHRQAMDTIADVGPEDPGAPVAREEFNLMIEVLKQQQNQVVALHRMRLEESESDGGSSDEDSSSDSDDEDSSDDDEDNDAAVNARGDAGDVVDAVEVRGSSGPELLDLQIDLPGTQQPPQRGAIPRHVRNRTVEQRVELRRMINRQRAREYSAGDDDSSVDSATTTDSADFRLPVRSVPSRVPSRVVWSARPKAPLTVPLAPGSVPPSMVSAARAAGVEAAAASITRDDEGDNWELKKIFDVKELGKDNPQMCMTELCDLQACSKWVSQQDVWFSCVDCQEKDFEGWPTGSLSDGLPVEYLTEDTYMTIAQLCSKQDEPAMPNVPIVTSLHRVAPQALVNTEGWVVDVEYGGFEKPFRGKIHCVGRDEQGEQTVTIAWLNGEASSVFTHPDKTEDIWLLFDDGKLAVEESDEEATEPLTSEERASRADLFSSGKLTKNQKKAASRETKRRMHGVPLVDYMGQTYLTPPQLQEAVHDILKREVSALKSVEAPMQRYLGVLERARVGQITEEELIAATVRYRTDSGKAMSEVGDGEFAGLINQSEGGRPGNDGRGGAIINYVTKRAALKHQKDCSTTDNNLTFRTDPCVRALDSIARFLDRRATGEKSNIVNCSSMIVFDICLHAFDLEDKSTSTKREKSYWKAIDHFCGKAGISRDVYFLGNGLLLYGEIEIHWLRHHKPFPLMTASGYADLELFNCPAPNTVTKKLRVTGDITHTENWVSDRIVGYSGEKKDGMNAIINDFFPCLSELAHLVEVPEPIDIAWKWAAEGLSKEEIEERMQLKLDCLVEFQKKLKKIRERCLGNAATSAERSLLWRTDSSMRNHRLALSDALGARQRGEEESETQQDLLWHNEALMRDLSDAHDARQRGQLSETQQDLLEAKNAGNRARNEESSNRLGMERAADSQVIEMRCPNPACTAHNEVRNSEWTYDGKVIVEKCRRRLKNGGLCQNKMEPVSTRGLKTISRNAVWKAAGEKAICGHPGCTNHAHVRGRCRRHDGKPRAKCNYPGCTNHVYARGHCRRHDRDSSN